MADSDDEYGFDDFDEDALAEIDAHTNSVAQAPTLPKPIARALTAQSTKPALSRPPPRTPPSAKRQRTPSGWVATRPSGRASHYSDDEEDLPDIIIREDGSYAAAPVEPVVNRQISRPVRPPLPSKPATTNTPAHVAAPAAPHPSAHTAAPVSHAMASTPFHSDTQRTMQRTRSGDQGSAARDSTLSPAPFYPQPQGPASVRRPTGARLGMGRGPVPSRGRGQVRTQSSLSVVLAALGKPTVPPSQLPNPSQRPGSQALSQAPPILDASTAQTSQVPGTRNGLHDENFGALQRQLTELKHRNDQIIRDLEVAQNARLIKEGEVNSLRRGIDKTAQEHAAALATLREAKEAAEAAQTQARRELQDEMERLRTQYMFRKQELETSSRKGQASVRRPRAGLEPPPTPVPLPTQMRAWAGSQAGHVNDSVAASSQPRHLRTPTRPRVGLHNRESPRRRKDASTLPGPSSMPKGADGALPGFVNAFAATPSRKSTRKGKQAIFPNGPTAGVGTPARSWRDRDPHSPPSSPTPAFAEDVRAAALLHVGGDERMSSPGFEVGTMDVDAAPAPDPAWGARNMPAVDPSVDEPEDTGIEPVVWREELSRVILSHFAAGSEILAMQVIMTANLSDDVDINTRTRYSSSCATVLRQLGVEVPWKTAITTVPAAFVEIMLVLSAVEMTPSLTALLDLMTRLCLSIRDFSGALLQTTGMDARVSDGSLVPNTLNVALFQIMDRHIRSQPKTGSTQDHKLLSEATLAFMEGLLFNISDELADRLHPLIDKLDCFYPLVTSNQPTWLIYRTARLITSIATRTNLAKLLMFSPPPPKEGEAPKTTSLPLLDALLHRMVERKRDVDDAREMREAICAFIATTSAAYPEAHRKMLSSKYLIPSIINCLYHDCLPIFEEDPALLDSPDLTAKVFRATSHALFLLYHLVLGRPPLPAETEELPDESHYLWGSVHLAPDMRNFQSTRHFFMVALSRLAHNDPPTFLAPAERKEFIFLSELADELLNLIEDHEDVDDAAAVIKSWRPFQDEVDLVDDILHDEEEMAQEARQHHYE